MATPRIPQPSPKGAPPQRRRPTRAASIAARPPRTRIPPPNGTQPITPPRSPRRRKLRADRLRAVTIWPILGVLVGLLMFSPAMRVTQLVPLGSQFTDEELNEYFNWDAWQGQYLWALWWNRGPLLALLNNQPRVDHVDIRLAFPGRIEVLFTEKERYATIIDGADAFLIAKDFSFMGVEPATRVRSTRIMTGVSPAFLFDSAGEPLDDPFPVWPPQSTTGDNGRYFYAKLLQLWRWIDAEQNPPVSQVAALSLDPDRGIILHYRGLHGALHPQILLGYGPELERKYGQALTIYRSGRWRDANNVEIDLRFDRTVVRAISAEASRVQNEQLAWLLNDHEPPELDVIPEYREPGTIIPEIMSGPFAE